MRPSTIEPETFRFVEQSLNQLRHPAPPLSYELSQKFYTPLCFNSVILLFQLADFILLASFLGNLKLISFLMLEFRSFKYCIGPLEVKGAESFTVGNERKFQNVIV